MLSSAHRDDAFVAVIHLLLLMLLSLLLLIDDVIGVDVMGQGDSQLAPPGWI